MLIPRHFIATLCKRHDVMTFCQLIQPWEGWPILAESLLVTDCEAQWAHFVNLTANQC